MTANDPRWAAGPRGTSVLNGPVDPALMREFKQSPFAPTNLTVVWALALGAAGAIVGGMLGAVGSRDSHNAPLALILTGLCGLAIGFMVGWFTYTSKLDTSYRLFSFARINDLHYAGDTHDQYPGMIFDIGGGRINRNVIRSAGDRPVEFGNHFYTTSNGKNTQTHRYGYMAVRVDNVLPNIVLDAEGNNGIFGSNLPVRFSNDQRLSLEGDFDRYFRMFCPVGYERDALYLFTPDVMIRFMDNASELDVEIVDDLVFFYSREELSTTDPRVWAWLFSVLNVFLAKGEQWERWRDERLAAEANPTPPATQAAQFAQAQDPNLISQQWQGQLSQPRAASPTAQPMAFAPATVASAALGAPRNSRPPNPYLGQKGVAPGGRRLQKSYTGIIIAAIMIFLGAILPLLFIR